LDLLADLLFLGGKVQFTPEQIRKLINKHIYGVRDFVRPPGESATPIIDEEILESVKDFTQAVNNILKYGPKEDEND
jgi:hypothetical protein